MNKILVVSDNVRMVNFFQYEVFSGDHLVENRVDYKFSFSNRTPDSLISLGLSSINLKDLTEIDKIIFEYDLVVSAHCKQIFPKKLVESVRCVNIHPGLNPYNRGWYPQVFSILNGLPIGATIHIMDTNIDHGPIIDQIEVSVFSYDTSFDIYERVFDAEKLLILKNIDSIVSGDYKANLPMSEGNYNSFKEFNELCVLDLAHIGSLREHLDLLRALTFKGYNNAYYNEDNSRVYVSISFDYKQLSDLDE